MADKRLQQLEAVVQTYESRLAQHAQELQQARDLAGQEAQAAQA